MRYLLWIFNSFKSILGQSSVHGPLQMPIVPKHGTRSAQQVQRQIQHNGRRTRPVGRSSSSGHTSTCRFAWKWFWGQRCCGGKRRTKNRVESENVHIWTNWFCLNKSIFSGNLGSTWMKMSLRRLQCNYNYLEILKYFILQVFGVTGARICNLGKK